MKKNNSILNYFKRLPSSPSTSTPGTPATPSTPKAGTSKENLDPKSKGNSGPQSPEKNTSAKKRPRSPPCNPEESGDNKNARNTPKRPKMERNLRQRLQDLDSNSSDHHEVDVSQFSSGRDKDDVDIFPHLDFPFLKVNKIRDKAKRSPDDPDYDSTTLFVPQSFLDSQTPAHRQWWEMKIDNFDTILFFKMGKFYELFHMDAVIAVKECNLLYMKKEIAHCGFPEVAFERYANILIDLGFKIARIEQVETPKMMEQRCKKMSRPTKFDKVVKRKICEKVSSGTRTFGDDKDDFLVAICDDKKLAQPTVGICILNTTLCRLFVGEFDDDSQLSKTHTLLTLIGRAELIYSKSQASGAMQKLLQSLPSVRKSLRKSPDTQTILDEVREGNYFSEEKGNKEIPGALKEVLDSGFASDEPISTSFAMLVTYLKEAMIDEKVFSFNDIHDLKDLSGSLAGEGKSMILFGHTLRNLEILPSEDNKNFNLFVFLNRTSTPFGRRMLKHWLCNPLLRTSDIKLRHHAIQDLDKVIVDDIKRSLKKMCDFEKLLAWIFAFCLQSEEHPDNEAVIYESENQAKKGIGFMMSCLRGFENSVDLLDDLRKHEPKAGLLRRITDETFVKELEQTTSHFKKAFNFEAAVENGKILPNSGMDDVYDDAKESVRKIEREAEEYRREQKRFFGCDIVFFGQGPNSYQLEVPERCKKMVDSSYTISSQRKGYVRYTTDETLELRERMVEAEEEIRKALKEVNRRMFKKFYAHKDIWRKVTNSLATLDCLISIYDFSYNLPDESCFPEPVDDAPEAFISIKNGRHPLLLSATASNKMVIPNDIELDERIFLLTGANMGGKSTIMRQTATLVILAQIGCKVPAEEMKFVTVDRLFSRMGARDNILEGESTFYVELLETSNILKHATKKSLVIMDELGRGTSTHDGCAIASAVLKHFINQSNSCRIMFTTHYHQLTRNYLKNDRILMYHMAMLEPEDNKPLTFLYKVLPDPCPKSHGFNAAICAGVQASIVEHAKTMAKTMEEEMDGRSTRTVS